MVTTLSQRIYGIFVGLTFTVVTFPTLILLAVVPGETNRRRLVQNAAGLFLRLAFAKPRVSGAENLPEGTCVVVSNHASYLDGVILTAVLPPRFTFVIKREMTRVPFANFLLRRIGSEFVDRSDLRRGAADARRILQKADEKRSLAFFPEGTFHAEPGLRHFHNGAFAAAIRAGAPVVPTVIRGSRRMLPADRVLPAPSRLEVVIKSPIQQPADNGSQDQLVKACRQSILDDLDEPDLVS